MKRKKEQTRVNIVTKGGREDSPEKWKGGVFSKFLSSEKNGDWEKGEHEASEQLGKEHVS